MASLALKVVTDQQVLVILVIMAMVISAFAEVIVAIGCAVLLDRGVEKES